MRFPWRLRGGPPGRGPGWLTALTAIALGCSSSADERDLAVGGDDGAEHGEPWADADGETPTTGSDDEVGDDGVPLDVGGGEPPPDVGGNFEDCPEALPSAWVLCEDFETIADPSEVALDYQGLDGAFALVDDVGASGQHSMQVSHREGEPEAGRMVLSFGVSPIDHGGRPSYAPEATFPEIYWRLRVMTEPGWPSVGPGELTRTVAFADATWAEALIAHLRSPDGDVTVEAVPVTCVSGDEVMCAGFDDQGSVESLGSLAGSMPLFAEAQAGQWHCIEGHLRLNTPGLSDGALEFWIDGERQAGRDDLDLRGTWTEYAINALVIDNHWPGGAPAPLRRWIDDVVVSTEPIGCAEDPDDAAAG
ncbi:MAG: hypothetical protein KDK70_06365 [Myxococcales bacterium]|nr:hypothetical protein [Myxococcales bacterium]